MNIMEKGDGEGLVRALLAVDIAGFGRRDDDTQSYLRSALYDMMRRACELSGIPWPEHGPGDRGDGMLMVVPGDVPVMSILGQLPETLASLLRWHNRFSSDPARIQLRAAVHIGYVDHDAHGVAGGTVIELFRILDAERLRKLLADSGADLAFAVSGYVYDSIISPHPASVDPGAFRPLAVETKETRTLAWVRLDGGLHPVRYPVVRPAYGRRQARCRAAIEGTGASIALGTLRG